MSEKLHYRGRYTIRMERQGNAWVYEIFLGSGLLPVAAGFDLLSATEALALDGIAQRFCKGTEALQCQ